ncbi:MAG: glycosyl hydrolase, partial [Acidobacteria bacterium]|nr:glycosyl hydrolase [Acidobacteriota bacterium]
MKQHGWLRPANRTALVLAVVAALAVPAYAAAPVSPQTLMSKLAWRSIGPYIGGRVVAVTGVPGHANLYYAGTVGGGVWRSTDHGVHWENISDGTLPSSSPSIGAVAVAPSDPNVIYAGTGECDIRADMIPGDGVYRSADAGKSWQYAGLREARSTSALIVDPTNPDVVYAASMGHVFKPNSERGVFKTTDGGKTWSRILFVDGETGAISLVMDPQDPEVLYAAMWQAARLPWGLTSGGPGSGIYKTTDGGAHWTNITHRHGLPQTILGRVGLAVAASNPQTVYAIIQAKEGGVFRSGDAGATWTRVNSEMKLRQRGFYYMTIYVDPKDRDTVYAPEVDALWVSRDGGKTFAKLKTPHGDNHVLWIDPDNPSILLEGNDGGATVSTDGGRTWSGEHNQPTGQFYHVNIDDQFPFHIYGAQQDEGSFEGPSADPSHVIPLSAWHRAAYGESTYSVPQPGNPDITYGSGYFSIFLSYDRTTGEYRSVSPWPHYQEGASSAELKNRFGWSHPILFSPVDPNQLLTAAQYVFASDDHGQTWRQISPDLTRNEASKEAASGGPIDLDHSGAEVYPSISALAVSPLDGNVIWAGSSDGLVHVTADGGKSWQNVTPPDLPESWVSGIEPSHVDRWTAYLVARRYMWDDFRPYVFKSTDLGKHWTPITAGLGDNECVFDIRQDPNDAKLLFLGTSNTVKVSLDGGAHWQPLTLNLPVAQVRGIAIDTRQGQVVAATHGRAFWVLDDLALLEQLTKEPSVEAGEAFLFAPQQAWLTHAYGTRPKEHRPPDVGANPAFGATLYFHIPQSYDGTTPVALELADSQGKVIRRFDLHLET